MKYAFWIRGSLTSPRQLVDAATALAAYAKCATEARVGLEGYLSAFTFVEDFKDYLAKHGRTKGFEGLCSAAHVHWDVDRTSLEVALADTRRLTSRIRDRYGEPLVFYSGSKGFHISLPVDFAPSLSFNQVAKQFAMALAGEVIVDGTVYDKVRPFRAPNSRHPKTGLHKVRLSWDELGSDLPIIQVLAAQPRPFELPAVNLSEQAMLDWQAATKAVEDSAIIVPVAAANLHRLTLEFIRDGAQVGQRANRLFSAAANLGECGCPVQLAHALLTEVALDTGLRPSEVRRQIECGLGHVVRRPNAQTMLSGETT